VPDTERRNTEVDSLRINHEYGTDAALQAGLEIHDGGGQRTESDLDAVPVTTTTTTEMKHIHALCVTFIGS